MKRLVKIFFIGLSVVIGNTLSTTAQSNSDELANKLQNPLAKIVALPVQHNISMGSPTYEGAMYTMSLQPIVAREYEKFNMIHRGVINLSYLPTTVNGTGNTPALGDINYSFFIAPKKTGKLAWGVGPSFDLPTATEPMLGSGKWNVGASAVLVYQTKKLTLDVVVRQTNSIAGDSERNNVNRFVAQTLVAYGLGKGWVINTFPTITANWSAEKGQQWTVPVGGGVSKLTFLGGKLPLNVGVQYYHNAVRPDYAPKGELRFLTTFVFGK